MSVATPEELEVKDYSDFITVDLLSLEEMLALQANHDLNIVGFELFNVETGKTAWVYLIHGESVEQGVQMLEEFGVKNLSGFRVYAIKLAKTPSVVLKDSAVLSVGRVHPNNPEWKGGLKKTEAALAETEYP